MIIIRSGYLALTKIRLFVSHAFNIPSHCTIVICCCKCLDSNAGFLSLSNFTDSPIFMLWTGLCHPEIRVEASSLIQYLERGLWEIN